MAGDIDLISISYIALYSIIWWLTFRYYVKNRGLIRTGGVVILLFCIYSTASVLLYLDTGRGLQFSSYDLSLFPLLYLYTMIIISMYPLIKFDANKVKTLKSNNYIVIDSIAVIFIISSLLNIPSIVTNIQSGLSMILAQSAGGLDIYNDTVSQGMDELGNRSISNIPSILINVLTNIAILIFCFNVATRRRRKMTFILLFSLAVIPFYHLSRAQRGPALEVPLVLVASFLLFWPWYSDMLRRKAIILLICGAISFCIPFFAISHSRFDRSEGGINSSFLSYIGQENLNFDIYAFDNGGLRYGDRCFPMFKEILGFENVPKSFWERRLKYPNLRINDEVFIGYVGDFCLDFGPYIPPIIFILFCILFTKGTRIRNGCISFSQLLILQFLIVLGVNGGMKLFPFADLNGLQLIAIVLVYYASKIKIKSNFSNNPIFYRHNSLKCNEY